MNSTSLLRRGLLALALGLAAWPSLADDDCEVPVQQWQSRDAVRRMAAAQGWQVQRLKIDDGCYEIRGTDAQGRAFKAKLDPQTLKVLKIKHKERERERERERDRNAARDAAAPATGPAGPAGPARPDGAAPAPLFTPGSAPRGQIE